MSVAQPGLEVDYITGGWVGIAGPGLWLLMEAGSSGQFVRDCWQLIRNGGGEQKLLAGLQDPAAAGLLTGGLPSFALLALSAEATRAAVRGFASIRLLAVDGGPITLVSPAAEGVGIGETIDRKLEWATTSFQLSAGPDSAWPPRDGQSLLPLVAGAVLATAIGGRPKPVTEDPDLAPTQFAAPRQAVPRPVVQAAAVPEAAVPEMVDPDLAPTQMAEIKVPVLAPPVGPKVDLVAEFQPLVMDPEVAAPPVMVGPSAEVVKTVAGVEVAAGADPGAEQDEELIWKLDWWNSASQPDEGSQAPVHTPVHTPIQAPVQAPVQAAVQAEVQAAAQAPLQAPELPEHAVSEPAEEDTSVTIHRPNKPAPAVDNPGGRPLLPTVFCPVGHPNPPQLEAGRTGQCRVCAAVVPPQDPIQVPQPVLGVLRLSTGGDIPLDRDVFLGRDPSNDEERKARKPHILRLPSPGKDISRDHVEVRLLGWRVLVIDLGSANGTKVVPPGGLPEPLAAGGNRIIEPGTQVILADEVSFVYEVTG